MTPCFQENPNAWYVCSEVTCISQRALKFQKVPTLTLINETFTTQSKRTIDVRKALTQYVNIELILICMESTKNIKKHFWIFIMLPWTIKKYITKSLNHVKKKLITIYVAKQYSKCLRWMKMKSYCSHRLEIQLENTTHYILERSTLPSVLVDNQALLWGMFL